MTAFHVSTLYTESGVSRGGVHCRAGRGVLADAPSPPKLPPAHAVGERSSFRPLWEPATSHPGQPDGGVGQQDTVTHRAYACPQPRGVPVATLLPLSLHACSLPGLPSMMAGERRGAASLTGLCLLQILGATLMATMEVSDYGTMGSAVGWDGWCVSPCHTAPSSLCPTGTVAETGTIAGIASGLAMALIGAVTSYISYQQKKFCFSIQRKCVSSPQSASLALNKHPPWTLLPFSSLETGRMSGIQWPGAGRAEPQPWVLEPPSPHGHCPCRQQWPQHPLPPQRLHAAPCTLPQTVTAKDKPTDTKQGQHGKNHPTPKGTNQPQISARGKHSPGSGAGSTCSSGSRGWVGGWVGGSAHPSLAQPTPPSHRYAAIAAIRCKLRSKKLPIPWKCLLQELPCEVAQCKVPQQPGPTAPAWPWWAPAAGLGVVANSWKKALLKLIVWNLWRVSFALGEGCWGWKFLLESRYFPSCAWNKQEHFGKLHQQEKSNECDGMKHPCIFPST